MKGFKVKTLILIAFSVISLFSFADEVAQPKKTREQVLEAIRKMSPEERAAKIAARLAEAEKRNGGYLVFPATGNVIRVVNDQTLIAKGDIESLSDNFCRMIGAAIEIVSADAPANPKATVKVSLVAEGLEKPVLLVAPEDAFGTLNVSRLAADKPTDYVLRQRFAVEFWRLLAMTLGGYDSNNSPCIMRRIFSLKDLDKDYVAYPSPAVFGNIQLTCRRFGITPPRKISYRKACMEGIAPAPTNDIQRAVWEKVHSIPDKPIKISFDKDKQKPVVK